MGREHYHRRGTGRSRNQHAAFPVGHGRSWRGTAFGGIGAHGCAKIVDWYMDGKIEIDPMITHN